MTGFPEVTRAEAVQRVSAAALSYTVTIENSWDLARQCDIEGLPGVLVECGVFAGAQAAAMALASPGRLVHLFDSFEGIPEASVHDDQQPGIGPVENAQGRLVSSGISVCGLSQVSRNMSRWGIPESRVVFHAGWFQQTVPQWESQPIALLRLDGDLYESTKVCLEGLYADVVPGGYLIIDDYALKGCRKAVHEFFGSKLPQLVEVPGGGGPVWCRKV